MVTKINDAFNIFSQIGSVSSTKAKQEILSEGNENEVLKTLLVCAYNPFLQYNIKKIPVTIKEVKGKQELVQNYDKFLQLLVRLNKREVTGNAAITEVSKFLIGCNSDEYTWYTRVLEKDLKIGLADKGINKVFKDLIPTYDVLLADKVYPEDSSTGVTKAIKALPDRMIVQYKIDGYRLNIHVKESGEVTIRTRNGKFVSGYKELEKEAKEKLPRGYVYDGEIVAAELFDWIANNMKSSENVSANRDLFSEVMSHAFSKEENKQGIFNMFDMIPIKEWETHKTTETLETRANRIKELIEPLDLKQIVLVPTSKVYYKNRTQDINEIIEKFHEYLNVGWEGLMIKDWDSVYEFKRSKTLLKMKLMDNLDLPVVDVYEGTGKYVGMMGGVYVEFRGNQVGVGSGWSDEQRQYYWKHKNEIVGKTIEISYQAISKNKNGKESLSFPVFKTIREDK